MSAPPSEPLFEGRSIRVTLEKGRFLAFRPAGGNRFRKPPSVDFLYLPSDRLVAIHPTAPDSRGEIDLCFLGEFGATGYPPEVWLSAIADADFAPMQAALRKRLELPKCPRPTQPWELIADGGRRLESGAYISVVGTQGQPRFEQPDFEGVALEGDRKLLAGRVPGERYRVTGFYGRAWDPTTPIYPGYKGPRLTVDTIRVEPNGVPRPERKALAPLPPWSRRGPVFSVLKPSAEGANHLDFDTSLPDGTRVYALLTGLGARGTEWFAARLAQAALATLFEEPRYEPVLARDLEPPRLPTQDPEAWAAWLIERGPLPRGLAGLVRATGRRLGRVFDEAKVRGWSVGAGGILAAVRAGHGGRVAAFRVYGGARLYLEGRGRLQVLGFEHTFRRLPNLSPEEIAALGHGGAWTDHFGEFQLRRAPPEDGPFEVDLRPGDRLVLACGDALLDALEPIDRAPSVLEALRDGTALHDLPDELAGDLVEQGLGLVTIDV